MALAAGTLVGKPLTGHDGPVNSVAAAALPDGIPVIISGGDDRTVRVWRSGLRRPGRGTPARPRRQGERGGRRGARTDPGHHQRRRSRTVRVWWPAYAAPVGEPLRGHDGGVRRWRPGRCRTAPRSSSAAATDGRSGCGASPPAPRSGALTGHAGAVTGGGRGAAGRHPGHHQRRRRLPRDGAGVAAGRRHPGRGAADRPRRRGAGGGGRGAGGRHPGHHQRR